MPRLLVVLLLQQNLLQLRQPPAVAVLRTPPSYSSCRRAGKPGKAALKNEESEDT